ncbi:MAG TPA: hypothetical protein PL110_08430 [Candidatus Eremiobacteraeota bacterium]|nr:MAG: hypothetical protein BWY64_03126 [bacterium ADurb.Bin363]HPZ08126.1 hypothetical protein [Candidatus Eremiobacteraeota bacterium]
MVQGRTPHHPGYYALPITCYDQFNIMKYSEDQLNLINKPLESKIFLEGPGGTGKTTAASGRLLHFLSEGVRADSILIIVPQRTLSLPYTEVLKGVGLPAGGTVTVQTIGGLAQRMIELFWPAIAEKAGFRNPELDLTFLSLETAQYYMARIVKPLLRKGYFQTIKIERNRLYSQILDNLNKAALVGFPHTSIGERLKSSWVGEKSQERIYEEAGECAVRFRSYCLKNNLFDFSLKVEFFFNHLWTYAACYRHLTETYKHIIVDNIEEDTPVTHDMLAEWLPHFKSALVIYDTEGGFRSFLGSDPVNACKIKEVTGENIIFNKSFVTSSNLRAFACELGRSLHRIKEKETGDIRPVLIFKPHRYHIDMLQWVSEEIEKLVKEEQTKPEEIVVVSPFLTDSLRFSLMNRLKEKGIPVRSHRPSRALREEPEIQCLLTLAAIAHPAWKNLPNSFDLSYALMQAIEDLDLIRAQLLAENLYGKKENKPFLKSFDTISTALQERITYIAGEHYEILRIWIERYIEGPPAELDHFLSRLFGEVLSQKGFGFYSSLEAGDIVANLLDSVKNFRRIIIDNEEKSLGQEYIEMVQEGLVADQYIRSWIFEEKNSVLLAPAYTFLMSNRPVNYQFWLNAGSMGWWERLYQPLTHPYVLSRQWSVNRPWTDDDEFDSRERALYRLTQGLICRCRRKIYLGFSELGEQGYEQKGPLLRAIQRVLSKLPQEKLNV